MNCAKIQNYSKTQGPQEKATQGGTCMPFVNIGIKEPGFPVLCVCKI